MKSMERFLCMQDSSSSNYSSNRNFVMMLVILFLMEFARGMYILSYINFLPTVTSIAIAITSFAFSIHFIADAATNFVIGFYLKVWFKISTYIWILTCFYKLVFSDMVPGITIHNYFQCYYVRNCCESDLGYYAI